MNFYQICNFFELASELFLYIAIVGKTIYNSVVHQENIPFESYFFLLCVNFVGSIFYNLSVVIPNHGLPLLFIGLLVLFAKKRSLLFKFLYNVNKHFLKIILFLIFPEVSKYTNLSLSSFFRSVKGLIDHGKANYIDVYHTMLVLINSVTEGLLSAEMIKIFFYKTLFQMFTIFIDFADQTGVDFDVIIRNLMNPPNPIGPVGPVDQPNPVGPVNTNETLVYLLRHILANPTPENIKHTLFIIFNQLDQPGRKEELQNFLRLVLVNTNQNNLPTFHHQIQTMVDNLDQPYGIELVQNLGRVGVNEPGIFDNIPPAILNIFAQCVPGAIYQPIVPTSVIESDIIAKCNICHEDENIMQIDTPFQPDCTCPQCSFTMCKNCFHRSISVNKKVFKCEVCKITKDISVYMNSPEYLSSIILDTENYNISIDLRQIDFIHKLTNMRYSVNSNHLFLTSIYNISKLVTNEDDIVRQWDLGAFRFITKVDSKKLHIMYTNINISFPLKYFRYDTGRFSLRFNIFNSQIQFSYIKYDNIWYSDTESSFQNFKCNPEVTFDENVLSDAYDYFRTSIE